MRDLVGESEITVSRDAEDGMIWLKWLAGLVVLGVAMGAQAQDGGVRVWGGPGQNHSASKSARDPE